MRLNINAVLLWAICFLGGYLFFGGLRAGLIGLFVGFCISAVATMFG